jgi:hypothetical protein
MNQAIKLNPNFSTAFADRGVAAADKLDYDRTVVGADPLIKAKPVYSVSLSSHGASYENRREGDRIILDASLPIRNNQYNAYAYSPDTFPPASSSLIGGEPAKTPATIPAPPPASAPVKTQASAATPKAAQEAQDTAKDDDAVPMPHPSPKRPARPPAKESREKIMRPPVMQPKPRPREAISHRAAISRADAWPRGPGRMPVRQ